jgi:hypothetical protein
MLLVRKQKVVSDQRLFNISRFVNPPRLKSVNGEHGVKWNFKG